MMSLGYYLKLEIQNKIISSCKSREIAVKLGEKGFAKRPNVLQYPRDVYEFAKDGATSFHVSEEHWRNPMELEPGMTKKKLDELRIGWDLILDVDSEDLEDSKLITYYLVEALKFNDVRNISVKYSGNKGFHLGIPFSSFPEVVNSKQTKNEFPDGPKIVLDYLVNMISPALKDIFKDRLTEVLKVDSILISSRHMYRAPYSLHEKSGLVSIPIDVESVLKFKKEQAKPENISLELGFLDNKSESRDASKLIIQAYDWHMKRKRIKDMAEEFKGTKQVDYDKIDEAIPEEFFPESIKKGLKGIGDGKKRFLFILINFLKCVGWSMPEISEKVTEWNSKNHEPLREGYVLSQLNWHKRHKDKIPPPNYDNISYYKDLGLEDQENIMNKFKNPVNYTMSRVRMSKVYKSKRKTKKNGKN